MHSPRDKLVARVRELGMPSCSIDEPDYHPVVSLEDFFEGNEDEGSIACDLLNQHAGEVSYLYKSLLAIRDRPDVQDVLVEIWEVFENDDTWPVSDRAYILTSMSEQEVESLAEPLQPSEVAEGYMFGIPSGAPELKNGMKVYGIWWD